MYESKTQDNLSQVESTVESAITYNCRAHAAYVQQITIFCRVKKLQCDRQSKHISHTHTHTHREREREREREAVKEANVFHRMKSHAVSLGFSNLNNLGKFQAIESNERDFKVISKLSQMTSN